MINENVVLLDISIILIYTIQSTLKHKVLIEFKVFAETTPLPKEA
jgi:hypothetical protein